MDTTTKSVPTNIINLVGIYKKVKHGDKNRVLNNLSECFTPPANAATVKVWLNKPESIPAAKAEFIERALKAALIKYVSEKITEIDNKHTEIINNLNNKLAEDRQAIDLIHYKINEHEDTSQTRSDRTGAETQPAKV